MQKKEARSKLRASKGCEGLCAEIRQLVHLTLLKIAKPVPAERFADFAGKSLKTRIFPRHKCQGETNFVGTKTVDWT